MKDWTAARSAGRSGLLRGARRRTLGGALAADFERGRSHTDQRDSRFVRTAGRKYAPLLQTQSYLAWQALVSAAPHLLATPTHADIVPSLSPSPSQPFPCERILDAPGLQPDPACNLLSWSTQDILAVGLCSFAYCWIAGSGEVVSVYGPSEQLVRTVAWHRGGVCLAVATARGRISLVDVQRAQVSRELSTGSADLNAISFGNDLLTVGDSQGTLTHIDIRVKSCTMKLERSHTAAVTRLGWNADLTQVASASKDGSVKLWELRQNGCLQTLQADGAVSGLAWHPTHRGKIVYAGSETRLYDHCSGTLESLACGLPQVAGLTWCPDGSHILAAGGSQIRLLKPQSREAVVVATTDSPILHVSSPAAPTLVTACRDETLLFWQLPATYVTK